MSYWLIFASSAVQEPGFYPPRFYLRGYYLGRFYLHGYNPSIYVEKNLGGFNLGRLNQGIFYPGSLIQNRIVVFSLLPFWNEEPG